MKKRLIIFPLIVALLLLFAACNNEAENDETTTLYQPQQSQFDVSQAVNAFNGETYVQGEEEESEIFSQRLEDLTELITVEIDKTEAQRPTASQRPSTTAAITAAPTTTAPTTAQKTQSTQTVSITFKEGQAMTEIFKILDSKGVASFDDLMKTAQTYDYSYYPLVAAIPSNANRCFKLEGYLFPDTYEFYLNQKPQDVIGKFLRNGKAKITDDMKAQASALGYSMDEVLTVASIIEKEGANSKEVAKIAAVIYNRLEEGMKLQMDSSIYYIERHVKPYLSGDINRYNSYYNTYKCSALPAGPISNPGLRTIKAALNPADVDYLYFCHDENANYYYAETYEEHLKNLELAGIE